MRLLPSIALAAILLPQSAFADGTEMLGAPIGLAIAAGTATQVAGVGMVGVASGTIQMDVPLGVTVKQVLLVWEGLALTAAEQGATDNILINGATPVVGDRVGGATLFFTGAWSSTYRADITGLGLIQPGMNSFDVSGLDFGRASNGVGVVAILDDGGPLADIQYVDGNDCAFIGFGAPLDTTVPVTYNFAPAMVARDATVSIFTGSVALEDPSGIPGRPTVVEYSVDGMLVDSLNDALNSVHGDEWDTLTHTVSIPAGATSLTVQALSQDSGLGMFAGNLEASLTWIAATLALEIPKDDGGGEGCTPGYWKQNHHLDSWIPTGYQPGDNFDEVFGVDVFGNKTLHQVIRTGGGQERALGRHAVAALLCSSHPDVEYGMTEAEVLMAVQDAFMDGSRGAIETLKNTLDELNNAGCPLN